MIWNKTATTKKGQKYNFPIPKEQQKFTKSQTIPITNRILPKLLHILNTTLRNQLAIYVINQDCGKELDRKHVGQFRGLTHVTVLEPVVLVGEVCLTLVQTEGYQFEQL